MTAGLNGIELMMDDFEWFKSLHTPMDAGARRAHFEQTEKFNAFHDGLNSPETQAKLAKAREAILRKLRKPNATTKRKQKP